MSGHGMTWCVKNCSVAVSARRIEELQCCSLSKANWGVAVLHSQQGALSQEWKVNTHRRQILLSKHENFALVHASELGVAFQIFFIKSLQKVTASVWVNKTTDAATHSTRHALCSKIATFCVYLKARINESRKHRVGNLLDDFCACFLGIVLRDHWC